MTRASTKRSFGQIAKLPSGRFRARYADPHGRVSQDGRQIRHAAPHTFDARVDAEAWLVDERRLISGGQWTPPAERVAAQRLRMQTFDEYSLRWLATRKVKGRPLADRTRDHYQVLLDRFLFPSFGTLELTAITPESVANWYDSEAVDTPTYRAHAYSLLRAIMRTAADPTKNNGRPLIPFSPCGISGGGSSGSTRRIRPADAAEVAVIVAAMPARHRLLVLLADGCALQIGRAHV